MNIITEQHPPYLTHAGWITVWSAIDYDSYDGPESPHGSGPTEREAIIDLCEQLTDSLEEANDRLRHENAALRAELASKPLLWNPTSTAQSPSR